MIVFFLKWKGAGGLKRCEKTNEDEARANMQLVDNIVDNPALNKWYGTYPIGENGVFIINREKAKMLLAKKLSQEQKPSGYKRKVCTCLHLLIPCQVPKHTLQCQISGEKLANCFIYTCQ